MTAPTPPGSARPGRVAGIALLGVAAVALIIGLITLFGSNGDDQADGDGDDRPPLSSSQPRPPSSDTSTITNPPSSSTTTTTTTTTAPGTSTPGTPSTSGQLPPKPPGDGNGEPTKSTPVRVYNNSTIKGLAKRAAADLRADGWQVTEVGNYSAGTIPTTTVYYRPGTDEEAVARAMAADFGMRVEPRFEGIQDAHPGVIVIVTNDYQGLNDKSDS